MNRHRRQKTVRCNTRSTFQRMVDWAKFLGLQWTYGQGLGVLRVGQGRYPMTYAKQKG